MSWSERQLAMLREMGITLWWPGASPRDAARRGHAASANTKTDDASVSDPHATVRHVAAEPATPTRKPETANVGHRPNGVEQLEWPALREAVANCTACQLCKGRKQTVFGIGHQHAHWMIVGEAPGEQEDRQGEPFVGRAGQLLDRMLEAVGLTRAAQLAGAEGQADEATTAGPERQVFIANVLKCRPPGNRNPTPEEVAQCEPYLKRQVQLVQPRIILAMGRFAVQSILQTNEPIGKLRGRLHSYAGVPVVVSYHPAYLLRNPVDKALAWDDLCLAREVLRMS